MFTTLGADMPGLRRSDVAVAVLMEYFEPEAAVYLLNNNGAGVIAHGWVDKVMEAVRGYSGKVELTEESISREENRSELIRMIGVIEDAMEKEEVKKAEGLKMIADIRVKLNDKFEIVQKEERKRIIVVPQKRDMICHHTGRECTFPSKEECMKRYGLVDRGYK